MSNQPTGRYSYVGGVFPDLADPSSSPPDVNQEPLPPGVDPDFSPSPPPNSDSQPATSNGQVVPFSQPSAARPDTQPQAQVDYFAAESFRPPFFPNPALVTHASTSGTSGIQPTITMTHSTYGVPLRASFGGNGGFQVSATQGYGFGGSMPPYRAPFPGGLRGFMQPYMAPQPFGFGGGYRPVFVAPVPFGFGGGAVTMGQITDQLSTNINPQYVRPPAVRLPVDYPPPAPVYQEPDSPLAGIDLAANFEDSQNMYSSGEMEQLREDGETELQRIFAEEAVGLTRGVSNNGRVQPAAVDPTSLDRCSMVGQVGSPLVTPSPEPAPSSKRFCSVIPKLEPGLSTQRRLSFNNTNLGDESMQQMQQTDETGSNVPSTSTAPEQQTAADETAEMDTTQPKDKQEEPEAQHQEGVKPQEKQSTVELIEPTVHPEPEPMRTQADIDRSRKLLDMAKKCVDQFCKLNKIPALTATLTEGCGAAALVRTLPLTGQGLTELCQRAVRG